MHACFHEGILTCIQAVMSGAKREKEKEQNYERAVCTALAYRKLESVARKLQPGKRNITGKPAMNLELPDDVCSC